MEISEAIFSKIRSQINIILVTAVPVEHEAVLHYLKPIPGFKRNYSDYNIGFFGSFLCMHVKLMRSENDGESQGGISVSGEVSEAVNRLRLPSESSPLVVIMPGIAAGLKRNTYDNTLASISEIVIHFSEEKFSIEVRNSILDNIKNIDSIDDGIIVIINDYISILEAIYEDEEDKKDDIKK